MKKFASIIGTALFLNILIPQISAATQIIYKSPETMGRESSLVASGKVQSILPFWNAAHTRIFTKTTIRINETFKGAAGSTVDIIQMGGVVGHVRMNVAGAARWKQGEETLLFLEPYGNGMYMVAGFSQGKFNIDRDPKTGRAYIFSPPLGSAGPAGSPEPGGLAPPPDKLKVPIRKFIDRALGSSGGGGSR